MNKVAALITGFVLLGTSLVFAQEQQTQTPVEQSQAAPIDAGNKICPVSGRPIGVMGPGVEEEYNGKIYHLCCGGCIRSFESDPERYSKIAEDEVKGQ